MTQEFALELLKTGRNIFLTGQAGSGKTYVINQYIDYLHSQRIPVAVTASTGIAATHIGGSTIHSWSGMGIKDSLSLNQMAKLKSRKYLKSRYSKVKVLILDEISMLHRKQFELLDELLKYMKDEPFKPFGGIQIVLSGDFLQLPPVSKQNEPTKLRFSFMSPVWVNAEFNICYLTSQYRQTNNSLFSILNEIRNQEFTHSTYNALKEKQENFEEIDEMHRTRLFTHNLDVDRLNNEFHHRLTTKEKTYKAKTEGKKAVIEKVESYSLFSLQLSIKLGARVMFIKNDQEGQYMNGTVGEVIDFSKENYPIVKTFDGDEIEAKPTQWTVEDEKGSVIAQIEQVPLRLAWAVTIHKSQGMTLDSAEIDLSKTFEPGQGYVALSRLKTLEGLQLRGINNQALVLDRLAFKADQRFLELSREAETAYTSEEIKADQNSFIVLNGSDDYDSSSSRKKKKKEKKLSTYQKTKQLIDKGLNADEIADERGLKVSSIIGHIIKIAKDFPDTNLSQLRPDENLIRMVNTAIDECYPTEQEKKDFQLKTIFEHLNEEIDYKTLRLALAFIEQES